jgi:hypothetical protein
VLWVCYEDLRSDLPKQIKRIAKFMGITPTDDLLRTVEANSSFAFMEARQKQFDEHLVFEKVREQMGIPREYVFGDVSVSKVRTGGGTSGEGKAIPESVTKMLADRWIHSIETKTGLKSYEEMRAVVNRDLS